VNTSALTALGYAEQKT